MAFELDLVLKDFYVIGISYEKTSVSIREVFAVKSDKQDALLAEAKSLDIKGLIILSTCNRTEVYTHTSNIDLIKRLLFKYSEGSSETFERYYYKKQGKAAVNHLYRVAIGLESQILGDFQVIGQLKEAYRKAEKAKLIDSFMNRMLSHAFQAGKKVKNETNLNSGTSSVAHAAVQYIKQNILNLDKTSFLLYGTGEIGKITCDNLVRHMSNRRLTLINRHNERAKLLANKYKIQYKSEKVLTEEINKADVVIVSTSAERPIVTEENIANIKTKKVFIDLSVPRNIDPKVGHHELIQLIDIDKLSQANDKALSLRRKSIKEAEAIIAEKLEEFYEWLKMHHLAPIFDAMKRGLNSLKEQELDYHRRHFSEQEFEKADLVATNIINRIARMGITHIKEVFKTKEGSMDILEQMFSNTSEHNGNIPNQKRMPSKHPKHILKT